MIFHCAKIGVQWKPSPEMLEQMHNEVRDGVSASNLPESIKDRYSDRQYDKQKPYHQEVRDFLRQDSLVSLLLSTRAAARALRNSDYVDPDLKRAMLSEILKSWKQLTQILFFLFPLLADRGSVFFDGITFWLAGDWGDHFEERLRNILIQIPANVVSWNKEDIFSQKLGPLLLEQLKSEEDEIKKHELILLMIIERPNGWNEQLQKYIAAAHKNSFYLLDVMGSLRSQYEYSYASPQELKNIEYLIKMVMAKHDFGSKKPGKKAIKKIPNSVLPERKIK